MKNFCLILLLFAVKLHSQEMLSKDKLLKSFKETIVQPTNGKIETGSNPWFTDNTNEIYYKNDTIILNNARSYKRDFCKIINWNFYKKNAFIIGDADYCSEPPLQRATKQKDFINLNVYYFNNDLLIDLLNNNKRIDKFKVISLEKKNSEYDKNVFVFSLKIVRLKS
jgi:hypothetical protein